MISVAALAIGVPFPASVLTAARRYHPVGSDTAVDNNTTAGTLLTRFDRTNVTPAKLNPLPPAGAFRQDGVTDASDEHE